MDIKKPWAQTLKYLRQSWQQVFVTHLAYTALGVVLFTPLIGLSGRLLLKLYATNWFKRKTFTQTLGTNGAR
jgi:hypothetical protein